jgi:hypothetical protein
MAAFLPKIGALDIAFSHNAILLQRYLIAAAWSVSD